MDTETCVCTTPVSVISPRRVIRVTPEDDPKWVLTCDFCRTPDKFKKLKDEKEDKKDDDKKDEKDEEQKNRDKV